MFLLTAGVFIIALSILGIGIFVLLRDFRVNTNKFFGIFSVILALWVTFNFLGANHKTSAFSPFFTHADFLLGPLLAYSFWLFTRTFHSQVKKTRHNHSIAVILLISAVVASFSSLSSLVVNITEENGATLITYGPLYSVYSALLLVLITYAIINLVVAVRHGSALLRSQVKVMLWGLVVATASVGVANLILPQLTSSASVNLALGNLAYLGLGLFVGLTAYSIAKHKLFDVRLAVARVLAYFLIFATLVLFYSAIVLVFAQRLTEGDNEFLARSVPFVSAIIIALLFGPTKKFFDRVTNKYFYQDAYEQQKLFNDLNAALVSTIDVDNILKTTSLLIEHYLKTKYVGFYTFGDTKTSAKAFVTDENINFTANELNNLADMSSEKVISTFYESQDKGENEIPFKENIELVAKLLATGEERKTIGIIILGPKKSGNSLNEKDQKTMEIIVDELVIAIQNALRFEEIQQFNVTLQAKVDKATGELRKANDKLIAMDQTKDDFISMASHQLRTPLTSVKGYVSMVLEGDVGKITKEQRKLLDQAFLSSQRMVYLIADLLNVSRLKTGKFIIEPTPTNLADVVEGELEQLKETAEARKLVMKYDKPKNFPVLNMDETKIRQVVMNFADNAIYYTPAGGHIEVAVADKGDTVEFTVTDDGIGVPKSEQHQLFNKFYRAGNAKKARPDGTGLGLFMAKKVVIAQGGNIIFKTQEGKGSTFGFSFEKKKLTPGTHSVNFTEDDTDSTDETDAPKQGSKA